MRKRVPVGEIPQYLFRRIDEAPAIGDAGIVRHRLAVVEDQNRKRLMLLAQELDDRRSRTREGQAMHLDLRCQSGKRPQQSLNRIAVWADEEAARVLGVFKSRVQQEQAVSTHGALRRSTRSSMAE